MSQNAHFFKLGLFIVCAIALAVAGLVVLGAGKLFENKFLIETYFTESVQGLEVGAPVRVRGVRVGRVETIHLAREEYGMDYSKDDPFPFRGTVVVRMSIRPEATGQFLDDDMESMMKKVSDAGLRVRLASQGITGVLYIESDFLDPQQYPPLQIAWKPKTPYIPSAPSTITELGTELRAIARKFDQVDIEKLSKDLDGVLTSATQFVKDVQAEHLGAEAKQVMAELRGTISDARRMLDNPSLAKALKDSAVAMEDIRRTAADLTITAKDVRGAMTQLPDTMARLNKSLRRVDALLAAKGETVDELLENLRSVSEELRYLTKTVEQYPSQVLFGEPPPRMQGMKR
jgi:phospholipid/cholesterol/gamma-HCH transport system substrate-binding protein/paraquat-inducible protein B